MGGEKKKVEPIFLQHPVPRVVIILTNFYWNQRCTLFFLSSIRGARNGKQKKHLKMCVVYVIVEAKCM